MLYKFFPTNFQPSPLPSLVDGELKYEVDRVTSTRKEGKSREYLVHWLGYNEVTWETVQNLTNCAEKLQEVWASKRMVCPHRIPYKN